MPPIIRYGGIKKTSPMDGGGAWEGGGVNSYFRKKSLV